MQHLWGKILAGELKAPGSFSLRVLDFLRNLSQREARSIELLSRFAIEDVIWRDDESKLDAYGINFSSLLGLQDLGVLSGAEAIGLERTWPSTDQSKFIRALRSNDKVLVVRHDDAKKQLKLQVYLLTAIGRQILRLGKFEAHMNYLRQVGKVILGQGFSVSIADFVQVSDTSLRFFNEEKLEAQQGAQADGPASGGPAA